jgi:hypothetical protein
VVLVVVFVLVVVVTRRRGCTAVRSACCVWDPCNGRDSSAVVRGA